MSDTQQPAGPDRVAPLSCRGWHHWTRWDEPVERERQVGLFIRKQANYTIQRRQCVDCGRAQERIVLAIV